MLCFLTFARYNGTPRGLKNCNEGGCSSCNGTSYPGSIAHECVCLHAEENALLHCTERISPGSVLYCNTFGLKCAISDATYMLTRENRCPCLKCTIKIIQTGVKTVVYNLSYKVWVATGFYGTA